MNKLIAVFALFFAINFLSFGQESSPSIEYKQVLFSKGIVLLNRVVSIRSEDYEMILAYDFDYLRNEFSRRKIDLTNGPTIELYSFDELISNNISFDNSIYVFKKGEDISANLIQTITKIDLGIGKIDISTGEKWETH
jgi:hypothetical protein